MASSLARYLPVLDWGRDYTRETLVNDLVAAVIVTIMLIPQSLAYALLAGLPPEVGIYASIAPIILYALFGTSRVLAVGPVAVVSLMSATAISQVAAQGSAGYLAAALLLAALSGAILLVMGVFRLGFLANFLSLIFSTQAFPVFYGTKNTRTKQPVFFRLECTIIDGLRLFHFST